MTKEQFCELLADRFQVMKFRITLTRTKGNENCIIPLSIEWNEEIIALNNLSSPPVANFSFFRDGQNLNKAHSRAVGPRSTLYAALHLSMHDSPTKNI